MIRSSAVRSDCLVPGVDASLLEAVLDHVDYGLILADETGRVMHVNRPGERRCDALDWACLPGAPVAPRCEATRAALRAALVRAARGCRSLVALPDGTNAHGAAAAVVPIGAPGRPGSMVLILLPRAGLCEPMSVQSYARVSRLTPAEAEVLAALCEGLRPARIADALGVSVSTVRTQIKSVRAKTGAPDIATLVTRLATLPPMMPLLR